MPPPYHLSSTMVHHPHPQHGMYGGWKPYRAYPQAPAHPGYYYPPPPTGAPFPPEPFHPPTGYSTAPKAPRPPPVVTIVNPRFETTELIYDINDHDVLCGRGAPTSWHPGNQFFRLLVDKYQGQYLAAKRMDKPEIAMHVVALVQERGGRFLKRTKVVSAPSSSSSSSPPRRPSHPSLSSSAASASSPLGGSRGHFAWQDIGEQRAYEKACQALREGAPELRKQLASKEAVAAALHLGGGGGGGGVVGTATNHHPSSSSSTSSLPPPPHLDRRSSPSPSSPFSSTAAEGRNDVESTSDGGDGCRSFQDCC